MHRISVTVGTTGNMTQIVVDGVTTGTTGAITKSTVGTNLFGFTFSTGEKGGFNVDASGNHAAFLVNDFSVGTLQRGATTLPAYATADLAGAASGYSVALNQDFTVNQTFNSNATVANNATLTFTGSDVSGAYSGSFPNNTTANTTTFGRWIGTYTQGATSGAVRVFLSVDKTFAATWACRTVPAGGTFPTACTFSAWNK